MATVCSGIGAPEVAAAPLLGWDTVFMSEIEAFPSAVLAHHYPDVPNLGDMTAINGDEWRDKVDVIVGGTPCQAFSVAGKRQSLADERGNLTLKFVELCDAIRPAFVVWENVPGVLSTADNAFGCFLGALAGGNGPLVAPGGKWTNAGYVFGSERAIAWRVLDAQYFGVAQHRRRVFLVACPRDGADPREILFESEGVRRDFAPSRKTREGVAGTIEASLGRSRGAGTPVGALTASVARTLRARSNCSHRADSDTFIVQKCPAEAAPTLNAASGARQGLEEQHALGGAGLFVPDVSPALQSRDYKGVSCGRDGLTGALIAFHPTQDPIHSADGSCHALGCGSGGGCATHAVAFAQNQLGDVRVGDISGTLNTNSNPSGRNAPLVAVGGAIATKPLALINMQVRRLTPIECERLQGFPDGYTLIPVAKRKKIEDDYRAYLKQHYPDMSNEELERLAKDGPRYKALGNSMVVPVMRWILRRIDATNNQVRM